jgi:Flp pilus assembly pilin Flp
MARVWRKLASLARDDSGQTTVEYALLIAVVGLPAITVFGLLVEVLAENYRMLTFLELLPFP